KEGRNGGKTVVFPTGPAEPPNPRASRARTRQPRSPYGSLDYQTNRFGGDSLPDCTVTAKLCSPPPDDTARTRCLPGGNGSRNSGVSPTFLPSTKMVAYGRESMLTKPGGATDGLDGGLGRGALARFTGGRP